MSPERRVSWPDEDAAATRQTRGHGPSEGVRERRLEVLVGDAADAVGAEESAHADGPTVTCTVSGTSRTTRRPRGAAHDGHDRIVAHGEVVDRDLHDQVGDIDRVEERQRPGQDDGQGRRVEPVRAVGSRAREGGADLEGARALGIGERDG